MIYSHYLMHQLPLPYNEQTTYRHLCHTHSPLCPLPTPTHHLSIPINRQRSPSTAPLHPRSWTREVTSHIFHLARATRQAIPTPTLLPILDSRNGIATRCARVDAQLRSHSRGISKHIPRDRPPCRWLRIATLQFILSDFLHQPWRHKSSIVENIQPITSSTDLGREAGTGHHAAACGGVGVDGGPTVTFSAILDTCELEVL